ncbi:LuxR family two component transcriptional regulator [Pseudonocardia cypriaca]|uniref:LuxR family two component transcriptional regulator n=2 Tax=Pseudonocardia cypriaca TaxID=882449 RepID=A0A543GAB0_9PSEU|nr:response regulator transcription factor [Pseudonocardia cypriaca]TQM43001.1 LuxR family two component transcriptional regulator [Pseudonocardia cypriaca]
MTDGITVMVVDDHPIWREGVARDLTERGLDVVATAPDADAAVRIARAVRPRVVLMDLNLGEKSGVQAIEGILDALPDTRILVLSASGEHTDVLEAVKAGAAGYLVKSASAEELLAAVQRTADGFPVFTPGLAGLVLGEYRRLAGAERSGPEVPALTERETDVLRLVAKGLTARQIGERLGVSHRTVETHVQSTLRKLQLHNRVQLARYAIEKGIVEE